MFKCEEEKLKNMLEHRERVLSVHVEENHIFKGTKAKSNERGQELHKEIELILKMEKNINAKKASVQQAEGENGENVGGSICRLKNSLLPRYGR